MTKLLGIALVALALPLRAQTATVNCPAQAIEQQRRKNWFHVGPEGQPGIWINLDRLSDITVTYPGGVLTLTLLLPEREPVGPFLVVMGSDANRLWSRLQELSQ